MTGFGRARASSNGILLHVECKSVNNRYLDLTFRLPDALQSKELDLKEIVQNKVERGSLNILVTIDKKETGDPKYAINEKLAKGYKQLLDELRHTTNIKAPVTLQDITAFESIFKTRREDEETVELLWQLTRQAAGEALDKLNEMRRKEGEQLKQDLLQRAADVEEAMHQINQITEGRSEELHNQLLKRIKKLVENENIDDDRLAMEAAILVDKMDITEEATRLKSHIKFFREALENDKPVGRRLKFLGQEMNREINTMGSKANHSQVSQLVVKAKESLEQIREQVLNIE